MYVRNKTYQLVALLGIVLGLLLLTAAATQAQTPLALTVSPPVDYIQIKPGSRSAHSITVENSSSSTLRITPSLVDFSVSATTGQPILQEEHTFPYIENEAQAFQSAVLQPGEKAQITLNFVVPQEAPAKEYHLSVLFSATPDLSTQNRTRLQAGVASNIIVLISGQNEHQPGLILSDLQAKRIVDSFAGIAFEPVAQNEHFHASSASGSATIKNWKGDAVAQFDIYPDVVLGFNQRPLRALAGTPEEPQPIKFVHKPFFLFGPYTITVELLNSSTTEVSVETATTLVFAAPLAITTALIVCLIIICAYVLYIRKRAQVLDNTV